MAHAPAPPPTAAPDPLTPRPAELPPLPADVRDAIQTARARLSAYVASYGGALPPGPCQRQLLACRGRLADALIHFDRAHQRKEGQPWT